MEALPSKRLSSPTPSVEAASDRACDEYGLCEHYGEYLDSQTSSEPESSRRIGLIASRISQARASGRKPIFLCDSPQPTKIEELPLTCLCPSETKSTMINTKISAHAELAPRASYPSPSDSTNSPRSEAQYSVLLDRGLVDEHPPSQLVGDAGPVNSSNKITPQDSSLRDTGRPPRSKRSPHTAFFHNRDSEPDSDTPPRKRQSRDDHGPLLRPLACPFFKSNPQKYQNCLPLQLKRIKDVKQHIHRKHSQPDFYCSRCYCVFETATGRDQHTRRASCEIRPELQFEGITEQQRKSLKQYVTRSKSTEGQWFEIWDIIFPFSKPPRSVYVGNYIEEAIPLLRTFWNQYQESITSNVVRTGQFHGVDQDVLRAAVESVFNRFTRAVAAASPGPSTSTSSPGSDDESDTTWTRIRNHLVLQDEDNLQAENPGSPPETVHETGEVAGFWLSSRGAVTNYPGPPEGRQQMIPWGWPTEFDWVDTDEML